MPALLDLPPGRSPRASAVLAHCFTCGRNAAAVEAISRSLVEQGMAVLRFDFTGLEEDVGDGGPVRAAATVADLVAASRYLSERLAPTSLLVGHSLGGAAVLQAAAQLTSVRGLAVIGAPADPSHVHHLLRARGEPISGGADTEVEMEGRSFRVNRRFLEDLETDRMANAIQALGRPLLILHSPIDNVVGIQNAASIFQIARHPKSFVSLDTADHLLKREDDSEFAGRVIGAWAKRYVINGEEGGRSGARQGRGEAFARTGEDRYATEILAGGHPLIADEPVSLGGTDIGPTPYELLLAALGSCTTITMRMYADRKEWPLESVSVRMVHKKVNASECEEARTKVGRVDRIDREIVIKGDLSEEQKARLMEIADRCPVHRTLHAEVVVRNTLVED